MREQGEGLVPARREPEPLKFASFNEIWTDMQQTLDEISRRAYEIFERNGRQSGHDVEDWFRAESELLQPVNLDLRESDNEVTVRAEVPGFQPKDLEVGIEGRQLTIAGKHETSKEEEKDKVRYTERRLDQIYRRVQLPAEVDSERSRATLKGGVLELTLPKMAPAKKIPIGSKAA